MARSHTTISAAVSSAKTSKKPAVTKGNARTPKNRSSRPPVIEMVISALKSLKNRKGSSLYAIKRYIEANYACNVAKLSPFIRNALKAGVVKGTLIRTSGIGASGSFKLVNSQAEKMSSSSIEEKQKSKVGGLKQGGNMPQKIVAKRPKTPIALSTGKAAAAANMLIKE